MPYTSSAAVQWRSSFKAVRMPSNTMKSLNKTIGNWMIGSGSDSLDAKEACQLVPEGRFKLTATISSHRGWDAKSRNPTTHKGIGHCFSGDV